MPHVVITGGLDAGEAAKALGPATEREGGLVLKVQQCFVSPKGDAALVEGVVVEAGKPTNLLGLLQAREDGVVVRLSPFMDAVDKTEGVQHWVAWLGKRIKEAGEGRDYGKTNLERFLG